MQTLVQRAKIFRTKISREDQIFQKKLVWGTNIFSEKIGPGTKFFRTKIPVTGLMRVQFSVGNALFTHFGQCFVFAKLVCKIIVNRLEEYDG